jgi:hypothetical protein
MRKDANHGEVSDDLRAAGWSVLDLAKHGVSVDLVVGKPFFAALVEIKDGSKPASARKLTLAELELKANWEGPYIVALSGEDALRQLDALYAERMG